MNTVSKRLYILAIFLAVGFSAIWLLPQSGDMKLSRLERHLPVRFDMVRGTKKQITGEELKILAKDTEFERMEYVDLENPHHPPVEVSVVFSGKDINNSIHRPERCLKSQGWNFTKQRKVVIKGALPDGSDLPMREIVCDQTIKNGERQIKVRRVQYYTFLGHEAITEDHYTRTLQDMKDRLFKGYDQQWAYATFSMPVTEVYAEQGLIDAKSSFTLEQSEEMLEAFIRKLAPLVVDQKSE
ncbi:MAG: exosortase-associated EpsI family protein [Akkermansiaceae bacterium]